MKTINITNAKNNLDKLVTKVNTNFKPITIINDKGKNAVLISEKEWKSIEEILYLSSIKDIKNNENWHNAKVYKKDETW